MDASHLTGHHGRRGRGDSASSWKFLDIWSSEMRIFRDGSLGIWYTICTII